MAQLPLPPGSTLGIVGGGQLGQGPVTPRRLRPEGDPANLVGLPPGRRQEAVEGLTKMLGGWAYADLRAFLGEDLTEEAT